MTGPDLGRVSGLAPSPGRVEGIFVAPGMSVSDALKRMDAAGERILFVVGDERRLLGIATDGDLRRWLISGKNLGDPVSGAMNASPTVFRPGDDIAEVRDAMLRLRIDAAPVVDEAGCVVSAVWWIDLFEQPRHTPAALDLPVVIMAGGEGSRLAPFTKVLPKPLIPVGEVPIVELIIERFRAFGCQRYYLSVNYKANLIKAYFADLAGDFEMHYLEEGEPMGTAGSLSLLKGQVDSTFFLSNCDILVDADYADLLAHHREQGNALTIVASAKHFTVPYGVCEVGSGGRLESMNEKPSFDFLVSTGMYVLEPGVLDDIPADRHYHVTDLINDYVARGVPVGVYPVSEDSWLDMGQWEELQHMRARFGLT